MSQPEPRPLTEAFFERDARVVAPELLGKLMASEVGGERVIGRIVEVEAYVGEGDAASHSHRGPTERNRVMFGPPGRLYVYFIYGMHWCANAVCGPEGRGEAVLIRALAPLEGVETMRRRRGSGRPDRDLCSGPAKLCQSLGIDGGLNGVSLTGPPAPGKIWVGDVSESAGSAGSSGAAQSSDLIRSSPRIGITKAVEHPWRWYIEGDPNVSR